MTRRIVFVTYPDFQALDLTGPLEVFALANRFSPGGRVEYRTKVVSPDGRAIRATSGIEIAPGEYRRYFSPRTTAS